MPHYRISEMIDPSMKGHRSGSLLRGTTPVFRGTEERRLLSMAEEKKEKKKSLA